MLWFKQNGALPYNVGTVNCLGKYFPCQLIGKRGKMLTTVNKVYVELSCDINPLGNKIRFACVLLRRINVRRAFRVFVRPGKWWGFQTSIIKRRKVHFYFVYTFINLYLSKVE